MDVGTGALSTLIPKLACLVSDDEYNLRKGVKREIEVLRIELQNQEVILHLISETPADQLDEQVKVWSRRVRDLSYDIESSVDRFMVRCKADKQVGHHGFKDVIKNNVDLLIQPIIRHKFAAEIRNIKSRVIESLGQLRFNKIVHDKKYVTIDPRISALYEDQARLVGIDGAKAELIKIMLEQNESSMRQGKIVSIVGFGGLGKTTLAKVVYKELSKEFDCSAFVSVSQTPDKIKILMGLLSQLDTDINREIKNFDYLRHQLRKFLGQKRCLVVIDDIWDIEAWKLIQLALTDNGDGYRIIITTRNWHVAYAAGYAYKMRPLSLSDSGRLFYNRIFGHEYKDMCPEELLEVSEKILEKCDGVPLAIITIAKFLAKKQPNKMEWYGVYNSFGTGGSSDKDLGIMREIVSLSYNDLPSHLRTCLLYLNVFPENYKIDKARLIWMWIAEGFIPTREGIHLLELGESYFHELINRSMIQPVYSNGMIEHCHVQIMILDLIRHLSRKENFVTILSDEYGTSLERVWRLSLQNGKENHTIIQAPIMQQVRSVIVFPSAVDRMPAFGSLRVLCVLDLNDCDLSQGLSLKYLGSLVYLKYLGLSNTRIAQLPEEVGNLQFLQILSVNCNEIASLPSTIVHLKHLMCLQIDMYTRVPNGIASLTSLEELSQIGIYDSADIEVLCCLTELRVLDISFHTESMDSLEKSLVDCLSKLQKVQNLSIWVASDECKLDALLDCLSKLQKVQNLSISVASIDEYKLDALPVLPQHLHRLSLHGFWLSTLSGLGTSFLKNLAFISIAVIELQEEDLKNLGRMPSLCYLNLKVDHENLGVLRRFIIAADLFRCLLSCVLWGFRGPVIYTQGAMPRLTSLQFTLHVRDMREIPGSSDAGYNLGLENLLMLRDVTVLLRCEGSSNDEVKEVKAALRHATKSHPNHPTIELIGYEDKDE